MTENIGFWKVINIVWGVSRLCWGKTTSTIATLSSGMTEIWSGGTDDSPDGPCLSPCWLSWLDLASKKGCTVLCAGRLHHSFVGSSSDGPEGGLPAPKLGG